MIHTTVSTLLARRSPVIPSDGPYRAAEMELMNRTYDVEPLSRMAAMLCEASLTALV